MTKIVIVGVCGSGKSMLVGALSEAGIDAYAVAQEHSLVPELFLHNSPDVVIYLDASDETVASRKQTGWEPRQLAAQRERLKLARSRADIVLTTDGVTSAELVGRAREELANL